MARQILTGKKFAWHHFSALEENDFEILKREFKFHPLDFDDLRNPNELPKLDVYKYYVFSILAIPTIKSKSERVHKSDLAIFVGSDYIVTVTRNQIESIDRFFARAKRSAGLKRELFGKSTGYFVYRLLDYAFRDSRTILQDLVKDVQGIEDKVYSHHNKATTMSLSLLRRDILFLRHLLDPQRLIVGQFINAQKTFIPKSLDVYFDDTKDTLDGMWKVSENLNNIIDGLFEVNEAFLSHRTNEIIRILTIISVILMPPTLISSYYGMNISSLPFVHSIEIVTTIIVGSLLVALGIIFYIDRKR
ncbi:hypothetical protein CO057_00930 [Candidatus Uhrbacteria bacterium CG_4_9_14_0_2_um_filter_41_50]|uniref:Magnesium transporter n=1 Tax=Candidatus Uhrbacteria bacterium CG_4_9_14_0_2_um_filter_41_50 TaxID=1975031 RepID=A0A2M8EQ07_9BACT|nr:MAG: hypothetical protein COZ45_03140 [Candidatus Uhrbacteria bacterium CG_4_10_14_3_um_filter_41_21]PIZ54631.1 MAG: hypothetical protein COY24_03040 [Candidatus Uhrbacteria bacterium CG_4_10_14_0_2_um_filter_41_21]PJB84650.1 MAG: hypothetical protein CO086_02365 [Candidatus Uhrbacteria bacterium CG_4_9_14_0_8_um_filter_41_16]PJC24781.1 MAG: hypothetical protein CO057_00930 [Candidatus Uhrbacteria bacterium CG_4_9_14_0_2_um_filter_41_50]PJE75124.1 MAG: hypothetical protein COV03_01710 [Candi